MQDSVERVRAELAERLRARRAEIERAALTRVYAISDPTGSTDPTYLESLRAAVSVALGFGLEAIESTEEQTPPVPVELLAQARIAARSGVSLDTVLRRYFAGYTLLGDFLIEEAAEGTLLGATALKRLLRAQAALFDRLLSDVAEEYGREAGCRPDTSDQRRAEQVQRLLDGELIEPPELSYEFDGWHVGAIASGMNVAGAIRELAAALDRRVLLVRPDQNAAWVWFGGRRRVETTEIARQASANLPCDVLLALGEPAEAGAGWRLTHQQAKAAFSVASRGPERVVRYADVGLLASIIRDDLLVSSLRQIFLEPLAMGRDDGSTLRKTLRAYFVARRNISSTAATLGVSRQTVNSRLRIVEQRLGCPLDAHAAEMELALNLPDR